TGGKGETVPNGKCQDEKPRYQGIISSATSEKACAQIQEGTAAAQGVDQRARQIEPSLQVILRDHAGSRDPLSPLRAADANSRASRNHRATSSATLLLQALVSVHAPGLPDTACHGR